MQDVPIKGVRFRVDHWSKCPRQQRRPSCACASLSLRAVLNWYSSQSKNSHFTEMCCGTEAGSCLRLINSCITQLKAQGPSRTCNESREEKQGCRIDHWSNRGSKCPRLQGAGFRVDNHPTLEATQGQIDGFLSQRPYKCHQNRVASVGD